MQRDLAGPPVSPLPKAADAEGLDRRATILREWLLFLKTYPIALLPSSSERPFGSS